LVDVDCGKHYSTGSRSNYTSDEKGSNVVGCSLKNGSYETDAASDLNCSFSAETTSE
jgi:hypothetical protein